MGNEDLMGEVLHLVRPLTSRLKPRHEITPEIMRSIFSDFQPKGDVTFFYVLNEPKSGFTIKPKVPVISATLSDDALILWAKESMDQAYVDGIVSAGRDEAISFLKKFYTERFLGGAGITVRTIKEIEEKVHGSTDTIRNSKGKVVWLGNGFSAAALEPEINLKGKQQILVDVFDYLLVYGDLVELKKRYDQFNVSFPADDVLRNLTKIARAIKKGDIKAIKYYVGSGVVPPELLNANLVVNMEGPSNCNNQLQVMLAPHGRMVTNYIYSQGEIGDDFVATPINYRNSREGTLIERK